jgi:hypothetical protein
VGAISPPQFSLRKKILRRINLLPEKKTPVSPARFFFKK